MCVCVRVCFISVHMDWRYVCCVGSTYKSVSCVCCLQVGVFVSFNFFVRFRVCVCVRVRGCLV